MAWAGSEGAGLGGGSGVARGDGSLAGRHRDHKGDGAYGQGRIGQRRRGGRGVEGQGARLQVGRGGRGGGRGHARVGGGGLGHGRAWAQRVRVPGEMAGDGARVVLLDGGLGQAQLLLGDVRLDLQVGQLVAQALRLDAQGLALALANLHLLLEHDLALDGHVVLGLDVLERRRLVARLALKVVVLHLDVAELEVQRALGVAQRGDFLLQDALRAVGLGLALLVLGLRGRSAAAASYHVRATHLPLLCLEADALDLLLQLALALLALLHVALQLGLELLAGRLELLQLGLQRLVRRLVVVQLLVQAAEPVAPPLGRRWRFRSHHGGRTAGVVGRSARCRSGSFRFRLRLRGDCAVLVLGWAGCGGEAGDPCVAGGGRRVRTVWHCAREQPDVRRRARPIAGGVGRAGALGAGAGAGVLFLPTVPSEVLTVFQRLCLVGRIAAAAVLTIARRYQPDANLPHTLAGPVTPVPVPVSCCVVKCLCLVLILILILILILQELVVSSQSHPAARWAGGVCWHPSTARTRAVMLQQQGPLFPQRRPCACRSAAGGAGGCRW